MTSLKWEPTKILTLVFQSWNYGLFRSVMSKPRGPPPPVAKKPLFNNNDSSFGGAVPTTINKLSSSLTDELNRKLATHLTLPTIPKKKPNIQNIPKPNIHHHRKSSDQDETANKGTNNSITNELQSIFARRASIGSNSHHDEVSSNSIFLPIISFQCRFSRSHSHFLILTIDTKGGRVSFIYIFYCFNCSFFLINYCCTIFLVFQYLYDVQRFMYAFLQIKISFHSGFEER